MSQTKVKNSGIYQHEKLLLSTTDSVLIITTSNFPSKGVNRVVQTYTEDRAIINDLLSTNSSHKSPLVASSMLIPKTGTFYFGVTIQFFLLTKISTSMLL
jgi:hypothetical protein